MAKLIANIILKGRIRTVTGLLIGSPKVAFEIGGVDKYVLRDPESKLPYIPGSSLKGKMRMLIEFAEGKIHINNKGEGKPCQCGACVVCFIFGNPAEVSEKARKGPTRLIVRDAYPTKNTIAMWENVESELLYTEYKGENSLDRITSAANPRFFERVVPRSEFDLEMVYSVYDFDGVNDLNNLKYVYQALHLLEHSSLGGHGSRGYGKVAFRLAPPLVFSTEDYREQRVSIPEYSDKDYKPLSELNVDAIVQSVSQKLSA
ncbi:MAG: type III-A CRISPR-associated RAMP protein Csm3 [Calditrichia bacterium]